MGARLGKARAIVIGILLIHFGRAVSLGLLPVLTSVVHAPPFLILGSFSLTSGTSFGAVSFSRSSKMVSSESTCSFLIGFAAGAAVQVRCAEQAKQKTSARQTLPAHYAVSRRHVAS